MFPLPETPLHRALTSLVDQFAADERLSEHQSGSHDQSTHGRRGVAAGSVLVDGTEFTMGEVDAVRSWQASFENVDQLQLAWRRADDIRATGDEDLPLPSGAGVVGYRVYDLQSAVEKSKVVPEGVVYRGIQERLDGAELTGEAVAARWSGRVGQTIDFKEPTSSSPDFYTASRFGNTLFEIQHGGAAKDISPLSQFPGFKEAVLPPSSFVVAGVRKGPDVTAGVFGPHSPVTTTIVTLVNTNLLPGGAA